MKKMLLLLAGMACLGMFVSCSDDPQEVVVSFDQGSKGYSYSYYGTATGTVVPNSSSTATVKVDSEKPFAAVSYRDDVSEQTNVKNYTLVVPVKVTQPSYGSYTTYPEITLLEVNGTYYCGEEEITVKNSPKSTEFTLTGTMEDDRGNYKFSTITFKRK
ncbi:MAG: hypothetical protein K2M90_02685 [Treponemataceae bacterium]|nr:hypothetical protein [Treponemataceae bacterium]